MSHFENLKKKKEWMEKQKYIVDYITNTLKLPNVTEDQILTILAIDHINGHTGSIYLIVRIYIQLGN